MTPAQALGWELWRRHRRGVLALGTYVVALLAIKLVVMARGQPLAYGDEVEFAFVVMVPLSCCVLYLLAVFTYGLSGDAAGRQSMYPPRMFTLPVSDAALVGWPMLYGTLALVVFWIVTRALAPWPSGLTLPAVWPVTLAAALMLWTQAAAWMPYPVRGARLIAVVLILQAIDAVVLIALYSRAAEWKLLAITVPQIPLAYVTARYAIARARRGRTPEWRRSRIASSAGTLATATTLPAFRSPRHAQSWFEWKRHGRALPIWVAIVLPFVLLVLWAAGTSTAIVVTTVLFAFATPVVMGFFTGVTVARSGDASGWFGMPAFSAVRPLTDGQLLVAKLGMTLRSALAAWGVVAIMVPIALAWSGTWPIARDFGRHVAGVIGTPRAVVFLAYVAVVFLIATWRQLVQSLYIGLTGNERLIKASVFASIVLASILGALAIWVLDAKRLGAVWSMLPLILGILVAAKMSAAAFVAVRLARARVPGERALLVAAIAWTTTVLGLYGVLAWLADTPHIPRFLLMMIAILSVPLVRLSGASLAVQQNRHR